MSVIYENQRRIWQSYNNYSNEFFKNIYVFIIEMEECNENIFNQKCFV